MKKRIYKYLLVVLLLTGTIIPLSVSAASARISGPTKINVGKNGTISITSNAPGGFFQGTISSDNNSIVSVGSSTILADVGDSTTSNPSWSRSIKGNMVGSTTVRVSISGEDFKGNRFSASENFVINVTNVSKPTNPTNPTNPTKPTNPGTSGPNTGSDRDEREKEEAKRDPAKAEELKKAEEEAEKKDKENTPLFSDIKITSTSEKKKDEVLETVKAEKSIFDYTYTLPKRIDSFSIDVKELDKDVTLTYDKEFSFKEDEKSIKIPIKAKKGDISQDITLEIKKNEEIDAEFKLEESSYIVYKDDALEKYMKANGFEPVKFKLGDVETVKFKKNKLELILLVDEKNNAKWVSIDEENQVQFEVDLVKNASDKLIVIAELTDDMKFEKINGEGYTAKTYELDKEIKEMDQSLVFDTNYKSWTLVEENKDKTSFLDLFTVSAEEAETVNEIVYAAKDDGTFDLLNNNDSDELATVMMMSFDQGATANFQLYAIIATGISVMLLVICFILLYLLRRAQLQVKQPLN